MPPRIKGTPPRPTFLQAWREHAGLTQDAVLEALAAQGIAISKPSLSRLENQRQPYSEPILLGLASVYGCSPADLISEDPAAQEKAEDVEHSASAPNLAGHRPRQAHFIRQWREFRGLSLRELEKLMENSDTAVSYVSLGRIERFLQPYSQPILEGLASVYGCSPVDLIGVDPACLEEDGQTEKRGSAHVVPTRQPRRPHFIQEWAEARGFKQVDLANEVGADKSIVSRWFNGSTPGVEWQLKLAALFGCEPESLFSHPDEEWFKRFLSKRKQDEIERIKTMLKAAFPDPD